MSLTLEGEQILSRVEDILKNIESLQNNFEKSQELTGEIKISCLPSFAIRWLPEVLLKFSSLHPKLQFNIDVSDSIVDIVSERIDVAIRVQKPQGADLVFRKIAENKLIFVAQSNYLKKHGTPQSLADLKQHKLLVMPAYSKCRVGRDRKMIKSFEAIEVFKTESGFFLTEMALAGAGIAIRSYWDVKKYIESAELIEILPKQVIDPFGSMYLVTKERRLISEKVAAFAEFTANYLRTAFN